MRMPSWEVTKFFLATHHLFFPSFLTNKIIILPSFPLICLLKHCTWKCTGYFANRGYFDWKFWKSLAAQVGGSVNNPVAIRDKPVNFWLVPERASLAVCNTECTINNGCQKHACYELKFCISVHFSCPLR